MARLELRMLKIETPCSAEWEAMTGNEAARFCASCQKHVHNVSQLTSTQLQELVEDSVQTPCMRIQYRRSGNPVTRDRARRVLQTAAVLLAATCGVGFRQAPKPGKSKQTAAATAAIKSVTKAPPKVSIRMGEPTQKLTGKVKAGITKPTSVRGRPSVVPRQLMGDVVAPRPVTGARPNLTPALAGGISAPVNPPTVPAPRTKGVSKP